MNKSTYFKKLSISFLLLVSIILCCSFNVQASEVTWNSSNWNNLDCSIYWYGLGNKPYKFIPGQANQAFDPSKPTILYIHGWQPGYYIVKHRESFYIYGKDTADDWIKKGWNVGVFYWNQFSDEASVLDAEAKIWTTNGPQKMRWRRANGSYDTSNSINMTAAQLLYNQYVQAMKNYTGNEIRIAGHSLGSQMAISLTKQISDNVDSGNISHELLPKRVALLDPYFSNLPKSYLGFKWTGEVARSYVRTLIDQKNIPFELYTSSDLTKGIAGDDNIPLQKMCATSYMRPTFYDDIQQIERHYAAKYTYFSSMSSNPPLECYNNALTGNVAASASTSDFRIAQMMGITAHWVQTGGRDSWDTSDDIYEKQVDSTDFTPASDLAINCSKTSINPGEYTSVKATVTPCNATNKMVIWSSSNSNVAKVCTDGTVKGIAPGKATVTAETTTGIIKTINITVLN
ncbi:MULTISPECIES: Ig-like domain-containing protein [Clostridium]|uniref:Ig-like domain-containing protein n=1 Tax=Clostridium TaxID=1485 RepID=UPI000826E1C0|nr:MULTISPECIES: Ig-like domain-containing protein [Clostridium]PJI08531.1 cell adhesion protein [Clostridium sp. CT7]